MPSIEAVVKSLDLLSPLKRAGSWDNVGLLLEGDRQVRRAIVAIDLTPEVGREALEADVDLVIAYHPPIFRGVKRLVRRDPRSRTLLDLVRSGVHVFSPHTALDAASGGINDWLLEAFGELTGTAPLDPALDDPAVGAGRRAELVEPTTVEALIDPLKAHLGLPTLRVSAPAHHPVRTVAVCPGAGGSLFEGLRGIDLLLTGEMRHHDVLGFAESGTACILTEHTNTERGYLPRYAANIREVLDIEVLVSARDADPLVVR